MLFIFYYYLQFLMISQTFLQKLNKSKQDAVENQKIIYLKREDLDKKIIFVDPKNLNQNKLGYSWYQTHTRVGIQIQYKLDKKQKLHTDITDSSVMIEFPLENGGEFHLQLELFNKIIPGNSKVVVHLTKIEVQLQKAEKNKSWTYLQHQGTTNTNSQLVQQQKKSYPTSSIKKKNWQKLTQEIQLDIDKHKEQYGEDPTSAFFKEIFKNADEDKRRAMIKSFQTSNGTVLSTDWGEVKKKDYEGKDRPSPPKGQQWKKPEY